MSKESYKLVLSKSNKLPDKYRIELWSRNPGSSEWISFISLESQYIDIINLELKKHDLNEFSLKKEVEDDRETYLSKDALDQSLLLSQLLISIFVKILYNCYEKSDEEFPITSLKKNKIELEKRNKFFNALKERLDLFKQNTQYIPGSVKKLYEESQEILLRRDKFQPGFQSFIKSLTNANTIYLQKQSGVRNFFLFCSLSPERATIHAALIESLNDDLRIKTHSDMAWRLMKAIIDIKADHEKNGFFVSRGIYKTESRLAKEYESVLKSIVDVNKVDHATISQEYYSVLKAVDIACVELRKFQRENDDYAGKHKESLYVRNATLTSPDDLVDQLIGAAKKMQNPQEVINFLNAKSAEVMPKDKHYLDAAIKNIDKAFPGLNIFKCNKLSTTYSPHL